MLGTLAYLASPHCECASCRSMHEACFKLKLRALQKQGTFEKAWEDDLSEYDLELLEKAGWPKERVREHVEAMMAMLTVLRTDREESRLDG